MLYLFIKIFIMIALRFFYKDQPWHVGNDFWIFGNNSSQYIYIYIQRTISSLCRFFNYAPKSKLSRMSLKVLAKRARVDPTMMNVG